MESKRSSRRGDEIRKISSRVFLALCITLFILPLATADTKAWAIPARKTVLVLSPFQIDLSANLIAAQSIREQFGNATDLSVDVYYEHLDINRFSDPAYQQKYFDLLSTKFANRQIDLVIVGSESMLRLWVRQRAKILPDAPIVFYDIFTEDLGTLDLPTDSTGVTGVEDCRRSVQWVLDAIPTVNEIVLVGGAGSIEREFSAHIQKLQSDLQDQVQFTDLSGLPLDEIKDHVAGLPATAVVLYHPMFEDADGTKYRPMNVLQEIAAVSSVPVIGGYDQFIGTGIVGGYMYSIDQQARDAAQISLRILRGEAVDSIPIAQNESNRFIFDHLALLRFNLPLSLLPPDSIIRNRQYSAWELYHVQIILALVIIVILLALVAFLGFTTQRLRTSRRELRDLNEHLESQIQGRTAALSQTNQSLATEIVEHKQTLRDLRESEEKFRMSFMTGMDAFYLSTLDDGRIIEINENFEHLWGYSREEAIGNTSLQLNLYADPADRAKMISELRANGFVKELDLKGRRKNGQIIAVSLSVSVITLNGHAHTLGTIRDVTERKRVEEEIKQLNANLEKRVAERTMELSHANRVKDEFLAMMSHELRTPLTAVLGLSETLLDGMRGPLNDRQKTAVQTIQTNGNRLLTLINGILDLSKIQTQNLNLRAERVNVDEICKSSLLAVGSLAANKSIEVEYRSLPGIYVLMVDAKSLNQILVNLLGNAIKFTPQQGHVSLEVTGDRDANLMRFAIRDNGIGIAPDDIPRLFEPFVQLDSKLSRQYEGTGLGLVLVKKLVELQGGSVNVQSESGSGSCFSFCLPWDLDVQMEAGADLPISAEQADGNEPAPVHHARILIADDEPMTVMVIRDYLEQFGYRVSVAEDGGQVPSRVEETRPDLILMDIQMPKANGLDLMRQLRADPRFASTPIIALTAFAMQDDEMRCMEAGANEYFSKPVQLADLKRSIERLLAPHALV